MKENIKRGLTWYCSASLLNMFRNYDTFNLALKFPNSTTIYPKKQIQKLESIFFFANLDSFFICQNVF